MAKRVSADVATSFEDLGKVRIRRLMVVRTDGKCMISFTLLRNRSNIPAVGNRREWNEVCTLDGEELPMTPDPYGYTGWRIDYALSPEELDRLVCAYHFPLKGAR